MRPFTPLAVMVMRGPDPHLLGELAARRSSLVFPTPIWPIIFPCVSAFLTKPGYAALRWWL
jgi:hypothetical protein